MSYVFAFDAGNSLQQGLNNLIGFIPNVLGALLILLIGFLIARVIRTVVTKLLRKTKMDDALHSGQTGQYVERVSPGASPARLIAGVVFWAIMLFVISAAIGALKIPALTGFIDKVFNYLPNVIVAILIFVVAGAVAAAVGGLVAKTMGDTPTGKLVASAVPALIMAIALFMILTQLKIAPDIVKITYALLLGAVALGMALAFGIGGREVAGQMLQSAYQKGQEQRGQVKQDLQAGRERAQAQAQQARDRISDESGESSSGGARRSSGAPYDHS